MKVVEQINNIERKKKKGELNDPSPEQQYKKYLKLEKEGKNTLLHS